MSIMDSLLAEFEHEANLTRRLLERAPEEKFDWKPHHKSMTLARLASHVAEIPQWLGVIMNQDEFEVDSDEYQNFVASSQSELLSKFDENVRAGKETMKGQSDEKLGVIWRFKREGKVHFEMPRAAVLRGFVLNHLVHHRGQLSVYLRLNEVPVPSIYGPSADEEG